MVRALTRADTSAALALLRERPLVNVFLEHVIRAGMLGRAPGFYGWERRGRLRAVLMLGPLGGTALEAREPDAFDPLARCAARLQPAPRHIVGYEEVTERFWRAFRPWAGPVRWCRREPLYRIDRPRLEAGAGAAGAAVLRPALETEVEVIVANSAQQHVEDLDDDRYGADPTGFRLRHAAEVREGRWWVLAERGQIRFQVHRGPENDVAVQIGGVFTPRELRGRGYATRGVAAFAARLLEERPSVTLFCGEDNAAARRVYERVGFEVELHYRSWLLDAAPCSGRYA